MSWNYYLNYRIRCNEIQCTSFSSYGSNISINRWSLLPLLSLHFSTCYSLVHTILLYQFLPYTHLFQSLRMSFDKYRIDRIDSDFLHILHTEIEHRNLNKWVSLDDKVNEWNTSWLIEEPFICQLIAWSPICIVWTNGWRESEYLFYHSSYLQGVLLGLSPSHNCSQSRWEWNLFERILMGIEEIWTTDYCFLHIHSMWREHTFHLDKYIFGGMMNFPLDTFLCLQKTRNMLNREDK